MIQNTLTCCLPTNRWSEIYPVCTWLLNLHVTFWFCSACCIWLICACVNFPCLWWEWYLLNQATTIFEMGSIYPPKKSWVCGASFLTLIMLFYSIRFFLKYEILIFWETVKTLAYFDSTYLIVLHYGFWLNNTEVTWTVAFCAVLLMTNINIS